MGVLRELRHEQFVRAYVRMVLKDRVITGCKWKAYAEVYPHVTNRACLYAASSRLLRRSDIQQRIREVTKRMISRMDITEEKILSQYQEAYDMARDQAKTADMVSATTAQAKLVGLLRERTEVGAPGDFDKIENVSEVLEEVERQAGPEAALLLANALGLKTEEAPGDEPQEEDSNTIDVGELEPPTDAVN